MSLTNYLISNKSRYPKKIAYSCDNNNITFDELYNNVAILSENLQKLKLKKRDKVGMIFENSILYPQIFYSAAYLDLSFVPLNPNLRLNDINNQLNKLQIKILFSWEGFLNSLDFKKIYLKKKYCFDLASSSKTYGNYLDLTKKTKKNYFLKKRNLNYGKQFLFGLTSGSTSEPKVPIWSQNVKILRGKHAKKIYHLNNKDKIVLSTPMYHSISFRLVVLSIVLGSTCVILKKFNVNEWFNTIKKWQITFSILVSDQIEMISSNLNTTAYKRITSLKKLVSCCSPLKQKIKEKLIKQNYFEIFDTYGASEVGTITNINLKKEIKKIKSNGKVVPEYNVKILKKLRLTKLPFVEGEICCATKNTFNQYFGITNKISGNFVNKFFQTGDIGYFDRQKYLYVVGRKKDIIIRGGVNIFPSDIEKILNNFPTVSESAVVGVEAKNLGEKIYAFLKLNKNNQINVKKFYKYCINNLADFQFPSKIFIVKDFPRASLNKISKYLLKKDISKFTNERNVLK